MREGDSFQREKRLSNEKLQPLGIIGENKDESNFLNKKPLLGRGAAPWTPSSGPVLGPPYSQVHIYRSECAHRIFNLIT